MECRERMKS